MILFCPRCGAPLPERLKGEWFDSAPLCAECGVAMAEPPAMLAPSDAEVTYGLDEWPVEDRAALTGLLAADDVPYRWEPSIVLVVPEAVEDLVDGILDDLEGGGADPWGGADGAADGGEEAQAAMVDLFVAADRLQRSPENLEVAVELDELADIVATSLPPYGIDHAAWHRIGQLALAVGASEDQEATVEAASALRDFLRHYV